MNPLLPILLLAGALLAGCSSMLPRASSATPPLFETYAAAEAAAQQIIPFKTSVAQLAALGFDASEGRNVTVIPYPDIIARLAPYPGVPLDQLDAGVRACIVAKGDCRGYVFRFEREDRRRGGDFVSDFRNIRRVTHVTGWRFEALLVVSEGLVLFRNVGGNAHLERTDRQTNPLGPLQPAGEAAGAWLLH